MREASHQNNSQSTIHKKRHLFSLILISIVLVSLASLIIPSSYASRIIQYPLPWSPWKAPYGLRVDSIGMVWFTESQDGNAIGRFNPTTKVYTEFEIPTLNAQALDLDIDSSGNIWFTESAGNKVGRLDPATGEIAEFSIPTSNSQPFGIRVDDLGNAWFTESTGNKIGKLTPSGSLIEYTIPRSSSDTKYLALDSQGRVWFAETNSPGMIAVLDPSTGGVTEFMAPTANCIPNGIMVDRFGFVWFTEYGGNKIARFDPKTLNFKEFSIPYQPGDPPNPWLLTSAPDGSIWFSGDQQFSNPPLGTGVAGRIDSNSGTINVYKIPKPPLGGTLKNHPKGIAADQLGNIWVALWDTDYLAEIQFSPATITALVNPPVSVGRSFTLQYTATSSGATVTSATVSAITTKTTFSAGTTTSWVTEISTSDTITKTAAAWVSSSVLTAVPISGGLSSGPSGDQSTGSTTFTSSLESIAVAADGSTTYLILAASQLWDSSVSVGASIAICRDGERVSGDIFSLGAVATHRHFAMAIALDTPAAGLHNYKLCFKTDPGGIAFVSSTYLVSVPVTNAMWSGPHGDQSTTSTSFTDSAESVVANVNEGDKLLVIGSSQLWNSKGNVGSSICISRDGARISGDMFTLGATFSHRHAATAIAIDSPTAGPHTYSLQFKTDLGGQAWVSGTYLIVVPISGGTFSGPFGDQSTTSSDFVASYATIPVTTDGTKTYLFLASCQIWNNLATTGSSMAICRDGTRISGDQFSLGAVTTHRHLASAISIDKPNAGTYNYALCSKTDAGF